jgi:hypothetical protein
VRLNPPKPLLPDSSVGLQGEPGSPGSPALPCYVQLDICVPFTDFEKWFDIPPSKWLFGFTSVTSSAVSRCRLLGGCIVVARRGRRGRLFLTLPN